MLCVQSWVTASNHICQIKHVVHIIIKASGGKLEKASEYK